MTRDTFIRRIVEQNWFFDDIGTSWMRISRMQEYEHSGGDASGRINPMAPIDLHFTPEGVITLFLPTRYTDLCPGRHGQLRFFRVQASDWQDAWLLIESLYAEFSLQFQPGYTLRAIPFEDIVILVIPAVRLIPTDLTTRLLPMYN